MGLRPDNEVLRRRVAEGMGEELSNREKVSRDDWLLMLFSKEHKKESEIAAHNFNVKLFNSLLSYASKVRDLSSKRPMYFINQKSGDLIVEVESKRFGLIPPEMRDGHTPTATPTIDELIIESDEDLDLVDQGYDMLDADDWFLLSFQNVNNINQITARLSIELDELSRTYEEVMVFEDRTGLQIDFYFIDDPEEEDVLLSYAVEKKRQMGFSIPVPKEEPVPEDIE